MPDLDSLSLVADAQDGLFLTAQAGSVGLTCGDLSALVRRGHVERLTRGLYVVTERRAQDPLGWHRQFVRGAMLLYPDAILTSTSAVVAHGVAVWGVHLGRPEVLRPVHRSHGRAIRIRPQKNAPVAGLVDTPLGPSVCVADAVVQLAVDFGLMAGVVSADCALHLDKVTRAELESAIARVHSWPRSSRARAMGEFIDARSESVAESRGRVQSAVGGITLIPQVVIRDENGAFVARVDFLVEGTTVVVEVDGKVKYADGDRNVLFKEKLREDRIRALGYVVVRITWADLEQPGAVVAKIRRALAVCAA